jgi:hypothetical protein
MTSIRSQRQRLLSIFLLVIVEVAATIPAATASDRRVRLFIPAPVAMNDMTLGLNAASVLNLAIWRTFQRAPSQTRQDVGRGTVIWSHDSLDRLAALATAKRLDAQAVLWGKAFPYGPGAILSLHLDLLPATGEEKRLQDWNIEIITPTGRSAHVTIDSFPERTFLFRPLVLKGDLLQAYASPDLLNIYKLPDSDVVIGRAGESFTASEQTDHFAKVRTISGLTGYLKLPPRVAGASSVTNFTGAIIRVLRTDWGGARQLLQLVANDPETPTSVLIDTKLLEAYCLDRQRQSGSSLVREALEINPTAIRSLIFQTMIELSEIARALKQGQSLKNISSVLLSLQNSIARAAAGLSETDDWLVSVRAAANLLASESR